MSLTEITARQHRIPSRYAPTEFQRRDHPRPFPACCDFDAMVWKLVSRLRPADIAGPGTTILSGRIPIAAPRERREPARGAGDQHFAVAHQASRDFRRWCRGKARHHGEVELVVVAPCRSASRYSPSTYVQADRSDIAAKPKSSEHRRQHGAGERSAYDAPMPAVSPGDLAGEGAGFFRRRVRACRRLRRNACNIAVPQGFGVTLPVERSKQLHAKGALNCRYILRDPGLCAFSSLCRAGKGALFADGDDSGGFAATGYCS